MRWGYFDCFAGASGDMILGCLFDLGFDKDVLLEAVNNLGIRGVEIETQEVVRRQIRGTAVRVKSPAEQVDRRLEDIARILVEGNLSDNVRHSATEVFHLIARAESRVHGISEQDVHFHEVGAVDSLVDVVGAFLGMENLGIQKVVCSPLAMGTGSVTCQHGRLPVPAPATMEIARGLPVRGWQVDGELTTPTGAAILRTCASSFGALPSMKVTSVGYGAGSRELEEIPNLMRLIVGESRTSEMDRVTLIQTNLDDINPQLFSHIFEGLFASGALDVWVAQVLMKKGRPGFLLSVLAEAPHVSGLVDFVLRETTTSGVRLSEVERIKLRRRTVEIETKYGRVGAKLFDLDGATRFVPEYEDCLRAARAAGITVSQVMEEARNAFRLAGGTSG